MGEFFRKALVHYKSPTACPRQVRSIVSCAGAGAVSRITRFTPEDEKFVGPSAVKPSEQSKLKAIDLRFAARICRRALPFRGGIRAEDQPGNGPGEIETGRHGESAERHPIRDRKFEGRLCSAQSCFRKSANHDRHGRAHTLKSAKRTHWSANFRSLRGRQNCRPRRACGKSSASRPCPWFRHDEGVLNHGIRTNDFLQSAAGPEQSGRHSLDGLQQTQDRDPWHEQSRDHRARWSHGCIRTANWDAARIKDWSAAATWSRFGREGLLSTARAAAASAAAPKKSKIFARNRLPVRLGW